MEISKYQNLTKKQALKKELEKSINELIDVLDKADSLDYFTIEIKKDDNPFLDPFFVEQLKKEYAGTVYYDRFILGKWTREE